MAACNKAPNTLRSDKESQRKSTKYNRGIMQVLQRKPRICCYMHAKWETWPQVFTLYNARQLLLLLLLLMLLLTLLSAMAIKKSANLFQKRNKSQCCTSIMQCCKGRLQTTKGGPVMAKGRIQRLTKVIFFVCCTHS